MITRNTLSVSLLLSSLAACAPLPQYVSPSDQGNTAKIRLALKDVSIISGSALLLKIDPETCSTGKRTEKNSQMMRIGRDNPLISELNPTGVLIPSDERILFRLMGFRDGEICFANFSIMPKTGKEYTLNVINMKTQGNADKSCPVSVIETDESSSERVLQLPDFESCPGLL